MISWNGKVHYFCRFSFFLTITTSGPPVEIRWFVCISKSQRIFCLSIARTDSELCIYHLLVRSNLNFLHNSHWITFPTQLCLVLNSLCANLLHSLIMWVIISSLSSHSLHLLVSCLFLLSRSPFCVVFCCYQKRSSFSPKVSFSYPCPSLLVWDFAYLLPEVCIELFFLSFLFSGYFHFVEACNVWIVSGDCNQSSSALFYVVVKSLYRSIDAILNVGKSSSSFFSWHMPSVYVISGMKGLMYCDEFSCSLVHLLRFFFGPFQE